MVVGIVGGTVLIVGIILIPYPGPGWLVVFMGLAILAEEFPWAKRALRFGREKYDDWNRWIRQQHWFVQSLTFIGTTAVVLVTMWVMNVGGIVNDWLHLDQNWLGSPFMRR